jgi:prophage regulatory protein
MQAPSTKRRRCVNQQPLEVVNHANALLTKRTVSTVAGASGSSIDRWVAAGLFPKPIKLSARCTRWRAGDVTAWLEQQQPKG